MGCRHRRRAAQVRALRTIDTMLVARHEKAFTGIGIDSVTDLFKRAGANERDPESLDPDVLFPLADAVGVRRDRRFIEKEYGVQQFADGTPVRFPTPVLKTPRYDLDAAHPGLVTTVVDAIAALTMARYRSSAFHLADGESTIETQLGGLLRSGILKRFESCWYACPQTVERMIGAHDAFLEAWKQGRVPGGDLLRSVAGADIDDAGLGAWVEAQLPVDRDAPDVSEFKPEYEGAVAADRAQLEAIRDALAVLDPKDDPKLAALRDLLEAMHDQKVAVSATYGATVRYLDEHLP